ncbi:MAG: tetratricopeptide repeat protein [Rhizomicrobium sp.]|nr:tetratricopeptide repeat protein [Rhizomicrobium sp.]
MGWENARRIFCLAWTACLIFAAVCASTPAIAAAQGSAQPTMETRAALLERDVADLRANAPLAPQASKDMVRIEAQQHEVNARVEDLKARFADFTFYASLVGLCLPLLGIGVGLAAYLTVGPKAKVAAEAWMDEHAAQLQKRIEGLEGEERKNAESMRQLRQTVLDQCEATRKEVAQIAQGAKESIGGHVFEVEEVMKRFKDQMNADKSPTGTRVATEPSTSDQKTMKQVEDELRAKPEKDYTANDWGARAFAAYAERAFERAAFYFQQAADASAETPVDSASYLHNRAVMLGEAGRYTEEITIYDDLVRRFEQASELDLRVQVAEALVNKGITLGILMRSDEEIAVYDDVVTRFGDAPELAFREQVAKALLNKGVTLGNLNRSEEEIAVYDVIIARNLEASEVVLREAVARALVNKGVVLGVLNRDEEALTVHNVVLERFADASDIALREAVARTLFNQGVALGRLNRDEEAIVVYDAVVARFAAEPEFVLREQVARALYNKGVVLRNLNRKEEASAALDEVVRRFGHSAEDVLKEIVNDAIKKRDALKGE